MTLTQTLLHAKNSYSDTFLTIYVPNTGGTKGQMMSELDTQFAQASQDAQSLSQRPDNDTMLKLYSLYKQGSAGDVTGDKPGFFDFIGVAKYEAWEKLRGMPQDDAKQQYIDLVSSLKDR